MNTLFAKNLKLLRTQKKLSQEQFATEIGLNRGNIASYEKGTAEPNMSNVLRIVKYFNIDLGDIVEKDLTVSEEFSKDIIESPAAPVMDAPEEHMIEELEDHTQKLERFLKQSNDMQKIVEGFKSYYLMKKSRGASDVETLVRNYEDLLDMMEAMLESNTELIKELEKEK